MQYNKRIDNGNGFDWGKASADYAKYRDIYPPEFYRSIIDLGCCKSGQKVLDIGTGMGVIPRNMYKYGADFIGTDISENQIKFARELSKGMNIQYLVSSAEELDFPDESFDAVTACQCFMYFDKQVIIPKIHRFLKQNGHFLILFMAWLPFESEIAKASEDLVLKFNPSWTGGGMTRYELNTPSWLMGLFEVANKITYEVDIPFTRESWNGRMKACRDVDASLPKEKISEFEREHMKLLSAFPESFTIPHWVSILDLKKIG